MPQWIIYAILSTLTGGAALVFAKKGMNQASEHMALVIRTGVLFAIIFVNAWLAKGLQPLKTIPNKALGWFALAGISTAVYWIFFFKAIKTADVSVVSTIDKGGILMTFFLSWLLLNEQITWKLLAGAALIISGTLLLMKR